MLKKSLIGEATKFAIKKHLGQFRRDTEVPYVFHPINVAHAYRYYSKKEYEYDDIVFIACLLHDVLEDTDTTYQEILDLFGLRVANLVQELTNDENEIKKFGQNGKTEYLIKKMIKMSDDALFAKLCDRLDNITDKPSMKYISNTMKIMEAITRERILTMTQSDVYIDIIEVCQTFIANRSS